MYRPITDHEYRHITTIIRSLTSLEEVSAYRAELRMLHKADPQLERVERRLDFRANELRSGAHA